MNLLEVNGPKLKEARERIGKSQTQLSLELGIPRNTYIKYEHGERTPPLHVARQLAAKLKIQLADVYLNGEELLFQAVNEPNDYIMFKTPYKYNFWHDSDTVELVYPDGTKTGVSVDEFMAAEKKIQSFIDTTIQQLKEKEKNNDEQ